MTSAGIPEDFAEAYRGLFEFVAAVCRGEVSRETLPEKADEWRAGDCRGSATLAGAAMRALRYELAKEGFEQRSENVSGKLRELQALTSIEAVLEPVGAYDSGSPAGSGGSETSEIVEVALPEQLREAMPNGRGFVMGEIQIIFEPTQGPPYAHMSVSHPKRYPTYEELSRAAEAPGSERSKQPNLWAWLPKPEEAKERQPNTVHLYFMPPEELLG